MKISELMMKIWEGQETVKKDVSEIKVTLAEQHATLEEHMRRSLANEEAVELLRNQLKPIENHVLMVNATTKIIVAIVGSVGLIASIIRIIDFIKR